MSEGQNTKPYTIVYHETTNRITGKEGITMKKTAVMILTAAVLTAASSATLTASAADSVNVTFSLQTIDKTTEAEITVKGSLTVTDTDKDGKLTPDDVMYLAHEKYYPGGAAAGLDSEYIWGISSCFTCDIFDKSGECVYTSSGPSKERFTLEDGDSISWTPQFIMNGDYYGITPKNAKGEVPETLLNTEPFKVSVSCKPRFKNDAVSTEGLMICVDGIDTNVRTDQNGNADLIIEAPGYHTITACKSDPRAILCRYDILVHENAPYQTASVKIYTESGIYMETALDFYDMDKDGSFTAYDAVFTALQRKSAGGETEFKNGKICGKTGFTVQVNDSAPQPLSKANQLSAGRNGTIVIQPAAQPNARSYAAAANGQTETVPAVTTAGEQTAETTAVTSESTESAANAQTTAAEVQTTAAAAQTTAESAQTTAANAQTTSAPAASAVKAGTVKAGDSTPIAALILAGLAAAGAAVLCTAKRRK